MTEEQYQRWRDFSLRMAEAGWPNATPSRKAKIASEVEGFLDGVRDDYGKIVSYDDSGDDLCVGGWLMEYLDEHHANDPDKVNRFENQVTCCIRAGLDVASHPSAGVCGFTVGMLWRMYNETLPAWVAEWFEPPLSGLEPDSAGVWL